jgi:hypothetical protein
MITHAGVVAEVSAVRQVSARGRASGTHLVRWGLENQACLGLWMTASGGVQLGSGAGPRGGHPGHARAGSKWAVAL